MMIGKTLSHYKITEQLGKGGMGEVYLADDTTLDRRVALKFLPEVFTNDPERMARFEREAKLLASLNHPNIAGIYGLEEADGNRFLVLEYVEGETLQARLRKGALSLDDALALCHQIAEGLEAAHEKGVIHRDLKPGNVMITAEEKVKILDFGLAKALADETQTVDPADSPTITAEMTRPGVVLGTAAYMSPEQAKGKSVDKRADIWAFGCILYECLTGKSAFEGETVTETLAGILKVEPGLEKVPLKVRPLLNHCLEKNPKHRLRDIGDAATLIEVASGFQPESITKKNLRFGWVWASITTLLAVALIILTFLYFYGGETDNASQFHLSVPPMPSRYSFALSPDGKWIAFVASSSESASSLFICEIGSVVPQQIGGTTGAMFPFWSPDSESIAFFAEGWLKRVDVSGKSLRDICRVAVNVAGGSWNQDGIIIFSEFLRLRRVSSDGGEPTTIQSADDSAGVLSLISPHFLPDGRHYIFASSFVSGSEKRGVYLGSLDRGSEEWLFEAKSRVAYVEPGYLIFQRDRTLYAQPFDIKRRTLRGEAVSLSDNLLIDNYGYSYFAATRDILVYRAGATQNESQFLWFDRTGKQIVSAGKPGIYGNEFDLSPDGRQIAATQANLEDLSTDIWLIEWERGISERFTFGPENEMGPVWSHDGSRISYISTKNGNIDIFQKRIGGLSEEIVIANSDDSEWLDDWSKDGQYIAYTFVGENGLESADIHVLPLFGDRKPWPIVQRPSSQDEPHFSYDGKWLAYGSDESGTWQVYIVSFPDGDQRRQISTNGGGQPRWREDGKELFYLSLEGKMMAVGIRTGSTIDSDLPRVLFDTGLMVDPTNDQYDVIADGQRFLLLKPLVEAESTPLTVVLNWTKLLEQ